MKARIDTFNIYLDKLKQFVCRNKWNMELLADDFEHKPLYYIIDTFKENDRDTVTLMLICSNNFNLEKDIKYLTDKSTSTLVKNITGRNKLKYVIIYDDDTKVIDCGRFIFRKLVNLTNVNDALKELNKYK